MEKSIVIYIVTSTSVVPVRLHLRPGDGLRAIGTECDVARTVEAVHPVVVLRDVPSAERINPIRPNYPIR